MPDTLTTHSAQISTLVVLGLESVRKTPLIGSLTGVIPSPENFRGSTLACERYADGGLCWMDTPGIFRESETETTRTTMASLTGPVLGVLAERLLVNSSAGWGPSDLFTLQECILEYRRRGHSLREAVEVFHNNPCRFLGQNPKWDIAPIRIESETA